MSVFASTTAFAGPENGNLNLAQVWHIKGIEGAETAECVKLFRPDHELLAHSCSCAVDANAVADSAMTLGSVAMPCKQQQG